MDFYDPNFSNTGSGEANYTYSTTIEIHVILLVSLQHFYRIDVFPL